MPPFRFRLRALIPRGRLPPTDEPETLDLNGRLGSLKIVAASSPRRRDNLILNVSGFESRDAALEAGHMAKSALRSAGVLARVAVDLGNDTSTSGLGQALLDQALEKGIELRGDVHGLDVIDESGLPVEFFRMEGEGTIGVNFSEFKQTLTDELIRHSRIDEKVDFACDVYLTGEFETTPEVRLVNNITVLEILATRELRPGPVVDFIDTIKDDLKSIPDVDERARSSLMSTLSDLKEESITQAVRALVQTTSLTPPAEHEKPHDEFVATCYTARSKLVHTGRLPPNFDLRSAGLRLQSMTRDVLVAHL